MVAIFYLAGWEMGAVEALSLSILVGSSVDYCVHVVEGYLLAGENPPTHAMQVRINKISIHNNFLFYFTVIILLCRLLGNFLTSDLNVYNLNAAFVFRVVQYFNAACVSGVV